MEHLTLSAIAASPYLQKQDVLQQAAQQLAADFSLLGLSISFSTAPFNFEELYQQLLPLINKLYLSDYPRLLQLLYRIDIEEQLIITTVKKEQLPVENVLTRLIICREIQKVLLRNYFKSKEV